MSTPNDSGTLALETRDAIAELRTESVDRAPSDFDAGYAVGWHMAVEAVAAGIYELSLIDLTSGRRSHEQHVADMVALFEDRAARINFRLGRPFGYRYRGGPVDYDTGFPAASACAWLRRRRATTITTQRRAA